MQMIRNFIKLETSGSVFLGFASMAALVVKNSSLSTTYDLLLTTPAIVQVGSFIIQKPLVMWVNDGLMAIFFLLVGLEIKREVLEGHLSSVQKILLPSISALGGLVVPAAIYAIINQHTPQAMAGWAIPCATDIAFALGVIMLLGKRIPSALKVSMVAIAILDDLAAIALIAVFYTTNLAITALEIGLGGVVVLFVLNKKKVTKLAPYLLAGIFLWACVLKSGIHATLAGVLVAFFIPLKVKDTSPLNTLEHHLHPWVAYGVLPIFAFFNAGVSLQGLSLEMLAHPITLGIGAGLFVGKQTGIMLFTVLGVMLKTCTLPKGIGWRDYYGIALLAGIGFTMSLFIGTLAFDGAKHQQEVRLGVLVGSVLSGLCGYALLATRKQ